MLCKLVTRIKNNQLVKMSKCLAKHIKILWWDLRTSEWKNLHGNVHFKFLFYTYGKKKRKNWWLVCKTKNLKVKWKLRRRQEAVSLWMMQVLKITNIQFFIFLSRLAFLSSASMKLKGNKWKRNRKKKDTLGSHALKEDVKTTRVSITSSIYIPLLVYTC